MTKRYPPTQMRQLYEALGYLKEDEQIALAELHVANPKRLSNRLDHSLEDRGLLREVPAARRAPSSATSGGILPIHRFRSRRSSTPMILPPTWPTVSAGRPIDAEELSFRYVDREVSPLRTTATPEGPRPARRSLDILLVNDGGGPIAAELKIGGDRPSYFAFIQVLMYAAELHSRAQRQRLLNRYGENGLLPSRRRRR